MYRIAICDDEKEYVLTVRHILREIEKVKNIKFAIDCYLSGEKIFTADYVYDLVFMDLELKNESGMDIIDKYRKKHNTLFVILTSHHEEIARGYMVRAFRFLTKPIKRELVEEAVASALKEYFEEKRIDVYDNNKRIIISISDIYYIEASEKNIGIRTINSFYTSKIKMKEIMEYLSDNFFMVHRSYIVNFDFIESFKHHEILMKNNEKIKISRLKYDEFENAFYSYLRGKSHV